MMSTPMGGGTLKQVGPERLGIRQLHQAATSVPQVTCMTDVDMTMTSALREFARALFEQQSGVSLGFMPFFIKAAAKGLRASPEVNGTLMPNGLWLHDRIQMGFSVNTPNGALVPVIRDPDRKSVGQIALELNDMVQRGRQGLLRLDEFGPSTFGISNGGPLGVKRDVPLVIPPHVATLTCGVIEKRPRVVNDRIEIRPVMDVNFGLDHRALDGDHAGKFLEAFKQTLETAQFA